MKRVMNIFAVVGLFAALTSCGSKSETDKSIAEARKSTDDSIAQMNKTIADAKQAGADAAKAGGNARTTSLNIIAPGGQPGKVELSGGFIDSNGQLIMRVTANLETGKSWKGEQPNLLNALKLSPSISEESRKSLAKLDADKTYLNLGCTSLSASDTEGLTEKTGSQISSAADISARKVFICGNPKLAANILIIQAKELVLMNAELILKGGMETMLFLTADDIQLTGVNIIVAKGTDGKSTLMDGPSLSLAANTVSGRGTLATASIGSSYSEETQE